MFRAQESNLQTIDNQALHDNPASQQEGGGGGGHFLQNKGTCTVKDIGEYILEQSASFRAMGVGMGRGLQTIFSAKPRLRFAYQWPDIIKMYK